MQNKYLFLWPDHVKQTHTIMEKYSSANKEQGIFIVYLCARHFFGAGFEMSCVQLSH